jgi:hypothetical protein
MIENAKGLKKEFKLFVIGVFICLFSLAGVNPLHAGWYQVTEDNQSSLAWGDFHFEIFAIPGHDGNPLYDISNVVFDITDPYEPESSQTLDIGNEWNLSDGGKKIDLNFYGDPYAAGETGGWWKVHINNPDGVLHGVTTYPSVVPEPMSSLLFMIGGAVLGLSFYVKKKRTA